MDSITKLCEYYLNWANCLAPIHYHFLLRALLVLLLACFFCGWALTAGNQTIFGQILCATVSFLLSVMIPVDRLEITDKFARGWLLLCGAVLLAFLPGILVAMLLPTVGMQRKARIFAYLTLVALFITNLFLARRQ